MNTIENNVKYEFDHFSEIEYIKMGEIMGAIANIEKNAPDKLRYCYDVIVFNNRDNYFAITVLAVVLREKSLQHYRDGNFELSDAYFKLYTEMIINFKDKFSKRAFEFIIQESCYYDESFREIIPLYLD